MRIVVGCDLAAYDFKIRLVESLRKEGYEVRMQDFMRIGLPFTLVAVSMGYLFSWLVWH